MLHKLASWFREVNKRTGGELVLGLAVGLVSGLGLGLIVGLTVGLVSGLGLGLIVGLAVGLVYRLLYGLAIGVGFGLGHGLLFGLIYGLFYGLIYGLAVGVGFGLGHGLLLAVTTFGLWPPLFNSLFGTPVVAVLTVAAIVTYRWHKRHQLSPRPDPKGLFPPPQNPRSS